MKRTVTILKSLFFIPVIFSLFFAISCETNLREVGTGVKENNTSEIIILAVMELLTICNIPLALRLFKFKHIAKKLKGSKRNLLRYGAIRILMLASILLLNTIFYYYYLVPTFGYLAIIILLAMIFIYPSKSRCKNEIEN
jgi:hypothetical protein